MRGLLGRDLGGAYGAVGWLEPWFEALAGGARRVAAGRGRGGGPEALCGGEGERALAKALWLQAVAGRVQVIFQFFLRTPVADIRRPRCVALRDVGTRLDLVPE